MQDEVLADYRSMFQNLKAGIQFVNDTFGRRPRVGWQIDPFGSSRVTSALYASLGYEAVMINRIGTTLKTNLEKQGGLEFVWETHPYTGKGERDNAIFTHVLAETYLTPDGFHPLASSPCFRRDFPDDCINRLWAKRIHPQFGR